MKIRFALLWCLAVSVSLTVCGCSSSLQRQPSNYQIVPIDMPTLDHQQAGWWRVTFEKHWPVGEMPAWHLDVLLAHQVVAPALNQYRDRIHLWRFHRRASRDEAGARFSFIFYSEVTTAQLVYQAIHERDIMHDLLSSNWLVNVDFDPLDDVVKSAVEATSDTNWPIEIQQVWPYYIMGVSEAWLALINTLYAKEPNAKESLTSSELDAQIAVYEKISEVINIGWIRYGEHAFLHHLSALFGYVPLQVRF